MPLITDQMKECLLFKIFIWEDVQQKLLYLVLARPFKLLVLSYNLFGKPPIEQGKRKLTDHVFTQLQFVALAYLLWTKPGEWALQLKKFPLGFNCSGPIRNFSHNLLSNINIHECFTAQSLLQIPNHGIALDDMGLERFCTKINNFMCY